MQRQGRCIALLVLACSKVTGTMPPKFNCVASSCQPARRIEPRLGSLEVFQLLLAEAHARNIRVILDGVFNHCRRGFFPFYDVMENRSHSAAFKEGFHIRRFPRTRISLGGRPLVDQARIDGWRLDAVGEVQGHVFWRAFRSAVQSDESIPSLSAGGTLGRWPSLAEK